MLRTIKRFSEDIDLILDWRELGITDEIAWQARSATKQDKFNQQIDEYQEVLFKPLFYRN